MCLKGVVPCSCHARSLSPLAWVFGLRVTLAAETTSLQDWHGEMFSLLFLKGWDTNNIMDDPTTSGIFMQDKLEYEISVGVHSKTQLWRA